VNPTASRKRYLSTAGLGVAVAAGGLFIVCALSFAAHSPRLWWRLHSANVTYDGAPLPDPRVFQSRAGDILVLLDLRKDPGVYLVKPRSRRVAIAGGGDSAIVQMPGVAISKEPVIPTVPMGSEKANFVKPDLQLGPRYVGFLTVHGAIVGVRW